MARHLSAEDKALIEAAERGDIVGVRAALGAGANASALLETSAPSEFNSELSTEFTYRRTTPLMKALRGNFLDIAKLLVSAGADPNEYADNGTPLKVACAKGFYDLTVALISAGAKNLNEGLEAAASNGHLEIVNLLIMAGATLSRLTLACACGFPHKNMGYAPVVATLIDAYREDVKNDEIALPFAARHGHLDIVRMLLSAGVDVNCKTSTYDETALMEASWNNHIEIVKELLAAGASSDDKTGQGHTVLNPPHWQKISPEIVRTIKRAMR